MRYPKILSWLSQRAGLEEAEGQAIWDEVVADADALFTGKQAESSEYWDHAVTALHQRIAAVATRKEGRNLYGSYSFQPESFARIVDLHTSLMSHSAVAWRDVSLESTRALGKYIGRFAA